MVDATAFGIPQRRRRLIVLGTRLDDAALPERLGAELGANGEPLVDAWAALEPLATLDQKVDDLHIHRAHSPKVIRRISAVPVGGTRHDLPDDLIRK